VVENGLKPKNLTYFKKEIIACYGSQHVITIRALESIGLLKKQEAKSSWPVLRDVL